MKCKSELAQVRSRATITPFSSIAVASAEAGREPEDQLGSLELVEPIGDQGTLCLGRRRDYSGRAGRTEVFGGHSAVGRKRPLAKAGDLEPIFTEEYKHGHAVSTINREQGSNFGDGIAIEKSKVDLRSSLREMVEDRALVNAVAAPSARQTENGHSA
jgi:hypothetical protein